MSEVDIAAEVIKSPAHNWLLDSYMPFAQYVIRSRALVADDGLKPVQRRILWQMFNDGITPDSKHMKAARVAGATVAYHPHGGASIEDALSRMAQGFALRIPLIDPAGSVGVVSGDVAAAARYWEARLTKAAMELLKEVKLGGVEMGTNFDGELPEPGKLPVRWPVSIINGTSGVAVGYASNMYAHNPGEVMDAARAVLKDPNISLEKLMKLMPGPDLPTGGELIGIDGVKDYYATGTGTFILRGRYTTETMTRGKMKIIFHELPYQVSAEDVMVKLHAAQALGKFKEIASVKDLTDMKKGLRLVIETKAGANHLAVINQLFKETPLENKFPVNATTLVDGRPTKTPMLDQLKNFIALRQEVTALKAGRRVEQIDHRMHQLSGILAVLIDIDKAIKIIRAADTADLARTKLQTTFKIDVEQADFILSMQLRRLTKQDSLAIKKEQADLAAEKKALELIMKDQVALTAAVDADLLATKKVIADPRRTIILGVTLEEAKEEQKVMAQEARDVNKNTIAYVSRFADGRVLRTDEPFSYGKEKKLKYSPLIDQIKIKSQEKIALIGSDGLARVIPASYVTKDLISTADKAGVRFPKGVKLVGLVKMTPLKTDLGIAIGTKNGVVKVVKPVFPNKDEFPVILLDDGDEVLSANWIGSTITGTYFYFVSKSSNILLFDAGAIRASGAVAGGVKGFSLKDKNDEAVAFGWARSPKNSVVISTTSKTIKVTDLSEVSPKGRGGQGVALHAFDKNETGLTSAYVAPTDSIVASITEIGAVINPPAVTTRAKRGIAVPGDVDFGVLTYGKGLDGAE
jgi:DNA gyrase subunit A